MFILRRSLLPVVVCIAAVLAGSLCIAGEPASARSNGPAAASGLEGLWDPAKYIGLDEIKPGAKAYCLTEYGVAGIEKFDLEAKSIAPGEFLSIVVQGMTQVKVDASWGAVAPGDLLTVSTVDGNTMKAKGNTSGQPNPNPIIGTALEAGTGLIWAMITLK